MLFQITTPCPVRQGQKAIISDGCFRLFAPLPRGSYPRHISEIESRHDKKLTTLIHFDKIESAGGLSPALSDICTPIQVNLMSPKTLSYILTPFNALPLPRFTAFTLRRFVASTLRRKPLLCKSHPATHPYMINDYSPHLQRRRTEV